MPELQTQSSYDFNEWDLERYRRAGEVLGRVAQRRDAAANMRQAVLALYFADLGDQPEDVA